MTESHWPWRENGEQNNVTGGNQDGASSLAQVGVVVGIRSCPDGGGPAARGWLGPPQQ